MVHADGPQDVLVEQVNIRGNRRILIDGQHGWHRRALQPVQIDRDVSALPQGISKTLSLNEKAPRRRFHFGQRARLLLDIKYEG